MRGSNVSDACRVIQSKHIYHRAIMEVTVVVRDVAACVTGIQVSQT